MATYWLSATTGDDADDGSTYALAKATMTAALGLLSAKGDILNIVNDGTHQWDEVLGPSWTTGAGTSFSDFGFKIRGSTSAGVAAQATIATQDLQTIPAYLFFIRSGAGFVIVEGLTFDRTAETGTATGEICRRRDAAGEAVKFRYCHFKDSPDSGRSSEVIDWFGTLPASDSFIEYCVFENFGDGGDVLDMGANPGECSITNSVFWYRVVTGDGPLVRVPNAAVAGQTVTVQNNTFYLDWSGDASATNFAFHTLFNATTQEFLALSLKDNVWWIENNTVSSRVSGGIYRGSQSIAGDDPPGSNDSGYNFYYSTTTQTSVFNATFGPYESPWDPDQDPTTNGQYTNDVEVTEAVEGDIFNDTSSTWLWENINSSGYDITVPGDLRLVAQRTGSSTGGVPGAITNEASVDLGITLTADDTTPLAATNVELQVDMTASGQATTVVVTLSDLTNLTYVSDVASQGTFDDATGIWTVGTVLDAATPSLDVTYTVAVAAELTTLTPDVTITSLDQTDSNAANDTDSVTLTVGEAQVDLSLAAVQDTAFVQGGDVTRVSYTFTNDSALVTEDNAAVTVTLPTNFSVVGTAKTKGSFSGTTWTVGSMAPSASETLSIQYQVDPSPTAGIVTSDAAITADRTLSGTTSNDTDTRTWTIQVTSPSQQAPFIDSAPVTEPEFTVAYNVRLRTERNRQEEQYLRSDVEASLYDESRVMRITLATNTSTTINMSGVSRGQHLFVESDVAVRVSASNATNTYFPAAKVTVLQDGIFEVLQVNNPSTTASANVLIAVVD